MASSISTKPFLSGRCPSSLPGHSGEVAGDADRLPAPPAPRLAHTLIEEPWSPTYLPLGTTAHKQGRIAGETAVGGTAEFAGSLGTQVVKVFELAVARTGLRDQEAAGAGFDPVTVGSVEFDHKAYYPGAHQLHLRITATGGPADYWAPSWSATRTPRSPNASTFPPPPCSTT